MAEQNSNGADQPGGTAPRFSVLAQYVKDLSFENPNAPRSLAPQQGPNINLQVNVNARQIAPTDLIIDRVATFRQECQRIGRPYDPIMVGVTRGLQIVHNEEERERAVVTRRNVLKNIGDLARGPGA